MIEFILDLQFIQRGLIAGILVAIICPIIGSFIVVRRLSLISEALSHVTLAGVGVGILIAQVFLVEFLDPLYIGTLFAVLGAFFIERLRDVYKHYQELSIPIVLSFGIGLGVVLLSITKGFNSSFLGFLFGSIVAVTETDVQFIFLTSILVIVSIIVFYKELLSVTFDEEFSRISGIPRKMINLIFAILVAITISIAMRVVGILLVSSLITIPVAISLRLAHSFKQVILYSIFFAQISIVFGICIGYYLEIATGGIVVLLTVVQLFIVLIAQKVRRKKAGQGGV